MKTRQDIDVIDHTGVEYAKIETELSWSIRLDVVYHEKQLKQWRDRSNKCALRSKWD